MFRPAANLVVTSALFGADSTTTIFLDQNSSASPRLTVTGLAEIEEGAQFDLRFPRIPRPHQRKLR